MLARKLEEFRIKLLDMSRRNRLLNYKEGNRSVQIFGQSAGELFQWLVNDKKPLRFAPSARRPRTDSDVPVKKIAVPPHRRGEKRTGGVPLATVPTAKRAPQRDDQLLLGSGKVLVELDEQQLDRRLLFLAREAQSAMQQQGCNILYAAFGLLDWVDPNDRGGKPSAAPLVLVPVELARTSVAQRYRLRAVDDEPIVNPTLIELCKSNFQLKLPALDSEAPDPLAEYFQALQALLAGPTFRAWSIRKEVHVGLFSFTKLLMYIDLQPESWPEGQSITEHPLVKRFCGLGDDDFAGGELQNENTIDDELHPRDCFQVVDADSSQQVAILSAKRGTSMVIEGPPGTGKSQTITNIIAECIASGKTVLFVAEKAAALNIVQRNLDDVGLGEFALSMHSHKANKRAILDELQRAVEQAKRQGDSKLGGKLPEDGDADSLFRLRNRLNEYVKQLHEKVVPLGKSRYDVIGECTKLRTAPEASFVIHDIAAWDKRKLTDAEETVADFVRAAARVGNPTLHTWRGVGLSMIPLVVRQQLPQALADLAVAVAETKRSGEELASCLGSLAPQCRQDGQRLLSAKDALLLAQHLDAASAAKIGATPPPYLSTILTCGRAISLLRDEVRMRWSASAEDIDWRQVAVRRRRQSRSPLRWLQFSWYRDTAAIRKQLINGVDANQPAIIADLEKFLNLRERLEECRRLTPRGREFFGALWRDDADGWPEIESHAAAVEAIRQLIAQGQMTTLAIAKMCCDSGRGQLKRIAQTFADATKDMGKRYEALGDLVRLDWHAFLGDKPESVVFNDWQERLRRCASSVDAVVDWVDFRQRAEQCERMGLAEFVTWCEKHAGALSAKDQVSAFRRQFHVLWLDTIVDSRPDSRIQRGDDLQAIIKRFREADRQWLDATRVRLIAKADVRRRQETARTDLQIKGLEVELRKKRGIMPIRALFEKFGDVALALKPCLLMSPMSAAQYLKPGKLSFDVVIFDEASQVEPQDALGAIARAKQVILVGDEKQLPPTNFFGKVNDADVADDTSDDDSPNVKNLESVLAMGAVCLRAKTTLRWHYRSQHNSLIDFSNHAFYDRELRVFPSPQSDRDGLGLSFRHVADGVYFRGKGQFNEVEASQVATAVIEHAARFPDVSLGVGAFSMAQQRAIEDEIERLRRASDSAKLEDFFNRDSGKPFFVKNLETIQGDEREVIFLSVGYGPDENKRLTSNFGPLNREGGWRRLNVLVTRARCRCVVFASFTADHLQLPPNAPRGVRALKDYLHFAEHGTLPTIQEYREDHDSPFEADVCGELRQRGWKIHAQVGCAGFSIDLAVVDPKRPGRYLLGIECDGATYHSSATARDRDRLRQDVLENLGWKIYRIWSTDWFERRADTLDRLLRHVSGIANLP